MTDDRAVELVRWGPCYARPRPSSQGEYLAALNHVAGRPALAERCYPQQEVT